MIVVRPKKAASAVTRDSAVAAIHAPDDCEDSLRGGGNEETDSPQSDRSDTWETDSVEDWGTVFNRVPKRRKIEIRDWLSSIGEASLNAIFFHFPNPFDEIMPMVGTCRKVFLTWMKTRYYLALDKVMRLRRWLRELDVTDVAASSDERLDVTAALEEIADLMR